MKKLIGIFPVVFLVLFSSPSDASETRNFELASLSVDPVFAVAEDDGGALAEKAEVRALAEQSGFHSVAPPLEHLEQPETRLALATSLIAIREDD